MTRDWTIGIDDGFSMSRPTGIGRYTRSIIRSLREHAPGVSVEPIHHVALEHLRPRVLRRVAYLTWLASGVPARRQRRRLDLVHFTNYHVSPRKPRGLRYAVTVHDLVPFRVPETKSRLYTAYLRRAIAQALRTADVVFADSYAVREELAQEFGVAPEGIRVCYVAPELERLPMADARRHLARLYPGLGHRPFVLFVGALERRKNLVQLVRAVSEIAAGFDDVALVLAGGPGIGYDTIERAVDKARSNGAAIHLLTQCSDRDLRALYSACATFVFPSLYEGYGIPLLEAMECGAPVIASDIPTNRELAGDAAVIVPPTAEGIAAGLATVLGSETLRNGLLAAARLRVADFTLDHTAQQLLDGYGTIL